jgi:ubiquinone/menaquinone biosynthesis C-methylase UbiE
MALDSIQQAAREQFDRQSRNYGRSHILADVSDVETALTRVVLPPRAAVLDVACGAGHTGLHLAGLGHEVTAADLSEAMLERVREAAAERGLRVNTRQHPAEEMPYDSESFDLVTCRIAPHHFSSPAAFVNGVARVLKRGGYFLLIDGSVPDDEPEAEAWLHEVEKLRDPSHARLLSRSAWRELCGAAGLNVLHAELRTLKQPDLEWYFETAATPPANRERVRELVAGASPRIREIYHITEEEGKIVWWWPRLTLIAQRNPAT